MADGPSPVDDLVLPFEVRPLGIRGRLVRLGPAIDDILHRHAYPPPVSALLAEAVSLTAMLGSTLKIDGKFTRKIHTNPGNQEITAALLSVAKQFDRLCVAEAVETGDEARWLAALGVDMMQGYAFGAPTVKPEFKSVVMRRSA